MTEQPLDSALAHASRGWRVFPCSEPAAKGCSCFRGEECQAPGKHPRIKGWRDEATTDEGKIKRWWGRWPAANIGIMTGAGSGLVVLDVDPRHGGDDSLRDLEQAHGTLPATPVSLTGGGGTHYLFAHPGEEMRNTAELSGLSGLDFRGDGGFIVAPGSRHESGGEYTWEASANPDDVALAPPPRWLLDARKATGRNVADEIPEQINEGRRNATLVSLAGTMRRRAASVEAIYAALAVTNEQRCTPPLDDGEVRQIAESVGRYLPEPVREISSGSCCQQKWRSA